MTASEIILKLQLTPLPGEGGYYRETFRSQHKLSGLCLPKGYTDEHCLETCIYYLITPDSFSQMHKLPGREIWHFYLGDPVEQLQISPGGKIEKIMLGSDILKGQHPQVMVPANTWQGTRLTGNGKFALFGTTMSPGFEFSDYQPGDLNSMIHSYPDHTEDLKKYFHS